MATEQSGTTGPSKSPWTIAKRLLLAVAVGFVALHRVTRNHRFVRGHNKDSEDQGGHTWLAFDLEEGSVRLNDIQSDVELRIERSRPAGE